ncbi:MAG TPA: hypothetical protein VMC41_02535 [Candidatus Nanoarchaeia archaeon]|nr:hypothetical protein [Candidatus Nanoarchaeia archaeon]
MAEEFRTTQDIQSETDVISWEIPEYQSKEKTKLWYAIYSLVAIALLAYAIFTQDFIFAIIIIFAAVLIVIFDGGRPGMLNVALSDRGVMVGKEFYAYDQIKDFFIIYEPDQGIKNLYLEFKRFVRPALPENEPAHYSWLFWLINFSRTRFSIPLDDMNPIIIRRNLLKYVKENLERTTIPLSEQLTKLFKL